MHIYAFVYLGIFTIVWIFGTYGVFRNRNHLIIKSRDPALLLLQLVGILVTTTSQLCYLALTPHFNCVLYLFGGEVAFCLVSFPRTVRTWHYCVQFHLALLRTKYRTNMDLKKGWEKEHWFFRNKWAGNPKLLRNICFSTCWIFIVVAVPQIFQPNNYAYSPFEQCMTYLAAAFATLGVMLIFIIFTIVATYLIWNARDAFEIKTELKTLLIIWCIAYALWVPWVFFGFPLQLEINSSLWMVIALSLTFCLHSFWPLFLIYRHPEPKAPKQDDQYKLYLEELEFLPFRNELFEFMGTQFCQENLLFYEAVTDWKRLPSVQRCSVALAIRETFIDDSGLCQINIDAASRASIEDLVKSQTTELADDTFDKALEEVLTSMHANSYIPFKRKCISAQSRLSFSHLLTYVAINRPNSVEIDTV